MPVCDWCSVKKAIGVNITLRVMVYLAVGKQSDLEQIPARWSNLTDLVHSFICICD